MDSCFFLSVPRRVCSFSLRIRKRRRTQPGNTSPPDSGARITFVRITRCWPIRPWSYVSVLEPYLLTMHKRVNLGEPSHCSSSSTNAVSLSSACTISRVTRRKRWASPLAKIRRISASGLQCRSRPTRECLPSASARESGTSRTLPPYGPRLALHTRSGHIETDR